MKRRALLLGAGLGALALGAVAFLNVRDHESGSASLAPAPAAEAAPRVVSLAPAITETLLAWNAGDALLGVSDYCDTAGERPRVGSAITPRYEAIARLRPNLIITTQVSGTQLQPLGGIAPTLELPWLTVKDITRSLRKLGPLVDRADAAERLALRFETELDVLPSDDAPSVLVLLGDSGDSLGTYWYIKDDSLHGALLRAAGGKNAAPEPAPSAPRLSQEELLRLDPPVIVVLSTSADGADGRARFHRELEKLTPLRAVREQRIGELSSPRLLSTGPALLDFIAPLRAELHRLQEKPAP